MSDSVPNEQPSLTAPEIRRAYDAYTDEVRTRNSRVACGLVFFLMPAGISLDYYVYPQYLKYFLVVRLVASALATLCFFALRRSDLRKWQSYLLCMGWYLIPAASISWMIAKTGGFNSWYYAGLNLVILAVSSVIQATLEDSIVAVVLIVLMYCAACFFSPVPWTMRALFNNFYFLSLTAVIVGTGNYFFNRVRFSEFSLRYELNRNKRILEETNQKLKELDEAKSRFFANISHELRTPLTLLIAPLESLLLRFNRTADVDTRDTLVTMRSNGMRLLKLINDLLDLVRLESGVMQVRREPLEVMEFVKGLASAARQVADDKRLKLETFVDPALGTVSADRDKLEKIVLNLVFNALKFTAAGGTVELRAEKQDNEFILTVRDTGMGISPKNLPHVFDRFWQADGSSRRKYQGVGIGLALVKELAEIQGGGVTVASEEGKGTTFTVRLPFLVADRPAERSVSHALPTRETPTETVSANGEPEIGKVTSEEWLSNLYRRAELFPAMTPVQDTVKQVEMPRSGGVQKPKLLVADDEPDMLRFLKSQLSPHYQVLEAVDGQQAIDKASQFLPDIILLDMMMPEKDGLEACREIRQRSTMQAIPIVMITARADEETKLAALEAGASDFLPKPFSTTELHVRVKNLVESYQYQNKLAKQNQILEVTIDQLKETETLLVQTEKMVSLGRMSAGIIHEINNPLNYATTGLYTLRSKSKHLAEDQRAEYDEILQDVEEGIQRVKSIVTDLKSFTHPDTEQMEAVEVAGIVASALKFLSNEWKDRVQIEQTLAPNQVIAGNRNKLLQVFVNLFQNSLDATKRKTYADGEKPTIWIEGRVEGGKSIVVIRDNGEGIETGVIDKVFDPFFTTKDVGEGMGLGLTICYRIIQEYEGRISVQSEQGKFCEFKLEFPAEKG